MNTITRRILCCVLMAVNILAYVGGNYALAFLIHVLWDAQDGIEFRYELLMIAVSYLVFSLIYFTVIWKLDPYWLKW